MVCIASFHGEHGHRDDVVSIDLNRDYTKLLSGGTDHMVCIWDLTVPNVAAAIEKSRNYDGTHEKYGFKTVLHMFPIYQSRQLHCNYVDCVQWMNELILSKVNKEEEKRISYITFKSHFRFTFEVIHFLFSFSLTHIVK